MMKLHSCKEVLISSDRMQLQVVIDYQVKPVQYVPCLNILTEW